ncbi:MAG TPA: hypothetical protein VGG75_38075 [Trebonia sp.]|jgi:hypothetical protein
MAVRACGHSWGTLKEPAHPGSLHRCGDDVNHDGRHICLANGCGAMQ